MAHKVYHFVRGELDSRISDRNAWSTYTSPMDIAPWLSFPKIPQDTNKSYLLQRLIMCEPVPHLVRALNTQIGVEVELENLNVIPKITKGTCWLATADGSLRNGVEYVSALGLTLGFLRNAWQDLDQSVFKQNINMNFSERCSIHIHVDVRNFTNEQLRNLLALYIIVENGLFQFAGIDRAKNINCLPLRETEYITHQYKPLITQAPNWDKYTACNFKPVSTQGTVEFRHLFGTSNFYTVATWAALVTLLVNYAKTTPTKKIEAYLHNLKHDSQYEQFLNEIFGPLKENIQWDFQDMDNAVTDARVVFYQQTKIQGFV